MALRSITTIAFVLGTLLVAMSFAPAGRAESGPLEPLTIETGAGVHAIEVEVARTPEERSIGLMHRTELAPDCGMLSTTGPRGRPRCG